jgi:amidase
VRSFGCQRIQQQGVPPDCEFGRQKVGGEHLNSREIRVAGLLLALTFLGLVLARSVTAFNYVTDGNGIYWGIQDDAPPRVDTGSIRGTQVGPGQTPAYSTSINGFGGLRVYVQTTPAARLNGEVMRGFGLRFDGVDRFKTTQSINMSGVTISRSVYINRGANWGRWLDTFTNTTKTPVTVKAAFGGQSGIGASGPNSSAIVKTSSGDAMVTPADAWVEVATPLQGAMMVGGPQITVLGTPASLDKPFAGAMTFAGNWLDDPFTIPLSYSGHEGNFQAYVNTLDLAPGKSKSLVHFVVLGERVTAATSDAVRAAVESTANRLAAAPEIADLTTAEICSIANFNIASMTVQGFRYDSCGEKKTDVVLQPPAPKAKRPVTTARYDVVEKTIGQLRADMELGLTTSEEITQAYLDRIEFYDKGQFGFHAYEVVASDAIKQARAADAARRSGKAGSLLGIPIAVKNLYDTFDMPTTNGSLTFAGFRPARDAFQVARLRDAGAVIIGKTALEEYATSGYYSNDAWGQTWNVFSPSKSAIASSGGSAAAVAASLAATALGSQTGDSLYGPASAASLVTLRGTDGLESGSGIMPLVWMTDFGGAMTRSVSDLADMLTIIAGTDPADPATAPASDRIPNDWRSVLDVNALKGTRIGFIPSTWIDPLGTESTIAAQKAALRYLVDAGATVIEMGVTAGGLDTPPQTEDTTTGNVRSEGWMQYIDRHPELAAQGFKIKTTVDVDCSQKKVAYVRADANTCSAASPPRMTPAEIKAKREYRVFRQNIVKMWMDSAGADHLGVDAIVYPGLLSEVSVNDGGGARPSFGRRDTPSAASGVPTIAFPAGFDDHHQPINIQLLGRAWDDARLVGMAYAFEHVAASSGHSHVAPTTAPKLMYRK